MSTLQISWEKPRAISPFIYGVNFPQWQAMGGLPFPLARQGGNRISAYNWENNASNAGSDWHHQNDGFLAETNEPGFVGRAFFEDATRNGAVALLTIPMTGYVAADKKADGDVNQTPNYLESRFWRSLPQKPTARRYPPDLADKTVYQDEYVAWLERRKGRGTIWYALDNEPDIWAHTHARIVPKTPTYADFLERSIAYAAAIKAVAPKALISGPVNYGWQGMRRFQDASDSQNREFLDFYLAGMRAAEKRHGRRLLDLLDIHFYPEARGGGSRITEDKPGTAAARIQSPRSLWDPSYVEDSWIAESLGRSPIALLPRLLGQIATNYPGTKLAITEYHYGGRRDTSGLLSQADVLGIYGRYGVFAACIWGMDAKDIAQLAAFRAFLNFDGKGARFGAQSLTVRGESPAEESVYAATDPRNPKRLTIVALNKTNTPRSVVVTLEGKRVRAARGYQITGDDLTRSVPFPVSASGATLRWTAPGESVVSLEVELGA